MKAIIPGSFDPLTVGHEALVKRALSLFEQVTVLLAVNPDKKPRFTVEERLAILHGVYDDDRRVSVEYHEGWLYEYLKEQTDVILVKGIRGPEDLAYEREMASFNYTHSGVETLFILADEVFSDVSSTRVREKMDAGGEWKILLSQNAQKIVKKFYE